jgi:LysM repeat protein
MLIAATISMVLAGCSSRQPMVAPAPVVETGNGLEGRVVGDERTAMEAAVPMDPSTASTAAPSGASPVLAPNAPDSYVVKRGDTLWAIAKLFLRDPWFWPEIWQVNPQIENPHRIYPGDTLRLIYVDGQPRIALERGESARVLARVRSEPLEGAITTIPYETIAAFMSRPSVLVPDQIKHAGYVLASLDSHEAISEGDTIYARGFPNPAEVGMRYNVVRVGDPLRDPEDNKILGYDGVYTGSGRVTRSGDPATLIMTDSSREAETGDKVLPSIVDVPLDFIPTSPRTRVNGRIMAVSDGVTVIGQYEVVVINRGARDGLVAGNVLAVFKAGGLVRDEEKNGFLSGSADFFDQRVRLPDERDGTFLVFKTFDRMSFGLIMEAKNLIHVADRVANP